MATTSASASNISIFSSDLSLTKILPTPLYHQSGYNPFVINSRRRSISGGACAFSYALTFSPRIESMSESRIRTNAGMRLRSTSAKSEKSSDFSETSLSDQGSSRHRQQLAHHFSLGALLEIIGLIWRLPGVIGGFLKKEEKMVDEVEAHIDEAADAIKLGAKVVEGLAEGIEKVAEAFHDKDLENVAETIDEDAKRVEIIMDKVKERTKIAHEELDEIADSLSEAMQGVEEVVEKVQQKGQKVSDDATTVDPKHEATNNPSATTPSLIQETRSIMDACKDNRDSPIKDLTRSYQPQYLVHAISSLFHSFLACPHLMIPSSSISRSKLLLSLKTLITGSLIMLTILLLPSPSLILPPMLA